MNIRTFPPVLLVMIGDGQHRASCDIMELTGLRVLSTSVQQAFCRKVFHSLYPSFFFLFQIMTPHGFPYLLLKSILPKPIHVSLCYISSL